MNTHSCEDCEWHYSVKMPDEEEPHLMCTRHYRSAVVADTEEEAQMIWTEATGVPCKHWVQDKDTPFEQKLWREAKLNAFKAMRAPKKSGSKRRKK